jgi:hypothetical protein
MNMMDRREFLKATSVMGLASGMHVVSARKSRAAQDSAVKGYKPGDQVDPETFFLDNKLNRVTLKSQVNEFTKIIYLLIIGGAYAVKPADKRGGMWCVDTVDDIPVHRPIYYNYAEQGVTFVPVAAPPVYGSKRYGYVDEVFLEEPEDSPAYKKAVEEFVSKTEILKEDGSLPFDPIFYDPRFRLLDNPNADEHVEAYGKVYPWQGRLKWHEDQQTYGTPTLWLLDRNLRVLHPPFYGNNYEAVPFHIKYTVRDITKVLDANLR